jgi:hypothetical protein
MDRATIGIVIIASIAIIANIIPSLISNKKKKKRNFQ